MSLVVPTLKQLGPTFTSRYQYESRILLRALLRECSYLPDSLARLQISKQVLSRFRTSKAKGLKALILAGCNGETQNVRSRALKELDQLQKKGYAELKHLQRANEGELKPLMKVLHYTYGRSGRRRHELLAPLLVPDETNSVEQTPTDEQPMKWDISTVPIPEIFERPARLSGERITYRISTRFSQLRALIESHVSDQEKKGPLTKIRFAGYQMPSTNIWARPMPRKRVKNLARRQRVQILSRVLPPLPEQDHARLDNLISGVMHWEGQPPRRKRIAPKPEILTSFDIETLIHSKDAGGPDQYLRTISREAGLQSSQFEVVVAQGPAQRHIRSSNDWLFEGEHIEAAMQQILEDALQLRHLSTRTALPRARGHRITYRFMKHLWTQVFEHCPRLERSEGTKKWTVAWGTAQNPQPLADPHAFASLFNYRREPAAENLVEKQRTP